MAELGVSERFACRVLGQPRAAQRKAARTADDEVALTRDIIALARQYGRYGYRRITALLRDAGWLVNKKRVERIWRQEGLKVPQRQPKRGRLWLNSLCSIPAWGLDSFSSSRSLSWLLPAWRKKTFRSRQQSMLCSMITFLD